MDTAGDVWKAVSPWIVSARLKLASAGQCLCGGLHHLCGVFVSVICQLFMFHLFYDDLQDGLNRILPNVRRLRCSCWVSSNIDDVNTCRKQSGSELSAISGSLFWRILPSCLNTSSIQQTNFTPFITHLQIPVGTGTTGASISPLIKYMTLSCPNFNRWCTQHLTALYSKSQTPGGSFKSVHTSQLKVSYMYQQTLEKTV